MNDTFSAYDHEPELTEERRAEILARFNEMYEGGHGQPFLDAVREAHTDCCGEPVPFRPHRVALLSIALTTVILAAVGLLQCMGTYR